MVSCIALLFLHIFIKQALYGMGVGLWLHFMGQAVYIITTFTSMYHLYLDTALPYLDLPLADSFIYNPRCFFSGWCPQAGLSVAA